MGNYMVCINLRPSKPTTAKLFDTRGNLRRLQVPVKAAELMLEEPGLVVSPVDELRRTRRILPMRADEDLQAGKIYLLCPAERLYCKVPELEMALIEAACRKRGLPRGPKVFPSVNDREGEKREGKFRLLGQSDTGFPGHRLGNFRHWNPVLEPIYEGK